eukprot:m.234890 g.234890  ORF g.234890 m.234890 type:complete len:72 (+) comp17090_c6_seq1:547-762(+)
MRTQEGGDTSENNIQKKEQVEKEEESRGRGREGEEEELGKRKRAGGSESILRSDDVSAYAGRVVAAVLLAG